MAEVFFCSSYACLQYGVQGLSQFQVTFPPSIPARTSVRLNPRGYHNVSDRVLVSHNILAPADLLI